MKQSYNEYLKSADWRAKRLEKLNENNGKSKKCSICEVSKYLVVHHLFYRAKWTATQQADLRVLCSRCHDLTHDLINKGKLKFHNRDHNDIFKATYLAVTDVLGLPIDPERIKPVFFPPHSPTEDRQEIEHTSKYQPVEIKVIPPGSVPVMKRIQKVWTVVGTVPKGSLSSKQAHRMFRRYAKLKRGNIGRTTSKVRRKTLAQPRQVADESSFYPGRVPIKVSETKKRQRRAFWSELLESLMLTKANPPKRYANILRNSPRLFKKEKAIVIVDVDEPALESWQEDHLLAI